MVINQRAQHHQDTGDAGSEVARELLAARLGETDAHAGLAAIDLRRERHHHLRIRAVGNHRRGRSVVIGTALLRHDGEPSPTEFLLVEVSHDIRGVVGGKRATANCVAAIGVER